RDLLSQFVPLLDTNLFPGLRAAIDLDQAPLGAHNEIVRVHRRDFFLKSRRCFGAQRLLAIMPRTLVEFGNQRQARREKTLAQRHGCSTVGHVRILAEKFEVLTIVKNIKELLVFAWAKEVRTQPGATTNHLPELGLGPHELEKDKVDDLRNINAGV